jgi:hypothetical protein
VFLENQFGQVYAKQTTLVQGQFGGAGRS